MQTRVLMGRGFLFDFGPSGDAAPAFFRQIGRQEACLVRSADTTAWTDRRKTSLFLQRIRNNGAGKAALRECNSAALNKAVTSSVCLTCQGYARFTDRINAFQDLQQ
jgi:hypothetical protein